MLANFCTSNTYEAFENAENIVKEFHKTNYQPTSQQRPQNPVIGNTIFYHLHFSQLDNVCPMFHLRISI